MIIKGKSRARPDRLSAHLLRVDQNEWVEVREIRGVVSTDLKGALWEMDALAAGSRSGKPLYHAAISPVSDRPLTSEQTLAAVDRLEMELGLTGQPRAIVVHLKKDREHIHVVWSRIDQDTGKAIPDSWNYVKHEKAARELERVFGHERVQGAHIERDGKERPRRTPSRAELRQEERAGFTIADVATEITYLWRSAGTGREFRADLEYAGYILARGDRRAVVIIDPAGEIHSLARRIDGAKVKEVREKLADIPMDQLPSVEEARTVIRERITELRNDLRLVHSFDRAALEAAHQKETAEAQTKQREAQEREAVLRAVRARMDAHLTATLYSSAGYTSMTEDARRHIADRIRVRESFRKGVAARYWTEKADGWRSQAQKREIGRLEREQAEELRPINAAEARLERLRMKGFRRRRDDKGPDRQPDKTRNGREPNGGDRER